jgi:hypothetical protein
MGWRNFSKTAEKKFLQPTRSECICFSVSDSVCPIYENMLNFHVGIKIWVSMWSFLSIVHPLQISIPMYKKKVRIQQENL